MEVEQYENATLYCGDCREIFDDLPMVQAAVTDPPYGIRYETRRRKFMERPGAIENDISAPLWCVPLIAGKVEDGGAVYICTQFPVMAAWQEAMIRAGLKLKTPIVWDKKHHTAGDLTGDYGNRVELILFGHKGRHILKNGRQSNLWSISRPPAGEHPTPKPVELMSRCIVNSTDPGAVVLDPFMGSGTTGVAALQQGRRFIGVEICERYFDIARRRIEAAVNQTSMFAGGGGTVKIGLIDVDGHNWPSLPLMKISAYHKARGDSVEPWLPMNQYDKVYMSKVFPKSADIDTVIYADEIQCGGTGYFYPDGGPPLSEEIEHTFPDYGLYPEMTRERAYGFLTRGCPRNCGFCIVGQKEGTVSRQVADLTEFWNGQREIKLLDPNILACKEREQLLCELAASGAWVDFTQGLDIRLVDGLEKLLTSIKIKRLHFAWDDPEQDLRSQFETFKKRSGLTDYSRLGVYVLTNYNSSHEQDLERVYFLRELGYDPYITIYEKETAPQETRYLQRWVNNRIIFRSCPRFEDYDPRRG